MSYILDSIKKSDQERSDINIDTPGQLKTPAYLEAPQPKKNIATVVYIIIGFVIACIFSVLIFLAFSKYQTPTSPEATVLSEVEPTASNDTGTKPPLPEVNNQQDTVVDSLYESREQQTNPIVTEPATVNEDEAKPSAPTATEDRPPSQSEPAVTSIPSVFALDAATQRTIPEIKYDAHIYASDNNSGFVILNGAKKQVGDSLRSGIYIEKINQEDVVLSYNGLLFSLPALKSWSYQ